MSSNDGTWLSHPGFDQSQLGIVSEPPSGGTPTQPDAVMRQQQQRVQAMLDAHRAELTLGLMLLERMRTYLVDPGVEWLVPESWGWGEPGATGELYGIPFRVVAGTDALFLAQEVKPGA